MYYISTNNRFFPMSDAQISHAWHGNQRVLDRGPRRVFCETMSDGKTASRRALLGLTDEERRAWIGEWRKHANPADLRGFAEAQKTLFSEAAELARAGLTAASPEAQLLAERWMKLLRQHTMIGGVIRVHPGESLARTEGRCHRRPCRVRPIVVRLL
jgi:TipAS antibiotic-recognition domain